MIISAKELLDRFDQLPSDDQRQVASEILRRVRAADTPPLTDEELTASADDVFLALDREEAQRGGPPSSR